MDKIRLVLFSLLGISLVVSISGTYIIGGLILLEWTLRVWKQPIEREWTPSPLDVPLLVYFSLGVLVVMATGSTAITKAISTQSAFLLFIIMAHGAKHQDIRWLVLSFCFASGLVGLWGGIQWISGIDYDHTHHIYTIPDAFKNWPEGLVHELAARNGRGLGSRSHPLTYAEGLIPAIFLLTTFLINRFRKPNKEPKKILALGLTLALVLFGFVASQGRAVWLGTCLGLVLMSMGLPRPVQIKFLGGLILVGAILFGLSPSIRGRALSVFMTAGSFGDRESKSVRWAIWKGALNDYKEHPVFGAGLRGVKINVDAPPAAANRTWTETHNIFLQSALERGAVGVSVLLWILVVVGFIIWGIPPPWKWAFAGIFAAFMTAGLTESWLKDKEVAMIFWSFIGVAEFLRLNGSWDKES